MTYLGVKDYLFYLLHFWDIVVRVWERFIPFDLVFDGV